MGEARTGVALSDPLGMIASPYGTIEVASPQQDAEAIKTIVEDEGVVRIVVGVPLNQRGEIGPQAEKVLQFVEVLREVCGVEVVTIDERFSTVAAQRTLTASRVKGKKQRKVIDQAAAQHILQLYLDRERNRAERER